MLLRVQRLLIWPVLVLALVALAGWIANLPVLTGARFGTPMLPGAIALALLCCFALYYAPHAATDPKARRRTRAAAIAVLAFGFAGFLRHMLATSDTLNGAGQLVGAGWLYISPVAAFGHCTVAVALLLPEKWQRSWVYPTVLIVPYPLLVTGLVGYELQVVTLLDSPVFTHLSLFAIIAIALQSVSAMLLRPQSGWMAVVTSPSPAGDTTRAMLLIALFFPLVLIGGLALGRKMGLVYFPFGVAIAYIIIVLFLSSVGITLGARIMRSERAVRVNHILVETILENTPALIYAKDAQGRFLLVNRRLSDMVGLSREEIVGKTDFDIFPEDLARGYREVDARVMASNAPVTAEEGTESRGARQTFLSSKAPLHDGEGSVSGIVGISTEITALKDAESLLSRKVQRLALLDEITRAISRRQDIGSIFQASAVAVEEQFDADISFISRVVAPGNAILVSQMGPQTHRNRDRYGLRIGQQIDITGSPVEACIAQRQLIHINGLIQHIRPETPAFVKQMGSICVAPVMVEGEVYGVLIVAREGDSLFDPTERQFLSQLVDHIGLSVQQSIVLETLQRTVEDLQMSQASALARERMAAIGQMASGIAHDLNNGLTPISIHTQALREGGRDLPDEIHAYLKMVDRVIGDMTATIARMRDFYRPDNSELERSPTDLRELVTDVVELTRARWGDMPMQTGVVIEVTPIFAEDLPLAMVDAPAIRDALTNLILNAVDAMPGGGRITVDARLQPPDTVASEERIQLDVTDSGSGMDAETLARCIDPFFTTKGDRGTGLGLAMVIGTARRHGAELAIDSAPGEGTRIRMSLPVATEAVATRKRANGNGSAIEHQRSNTRVLIVDDDPSVLEATAGYLKIIGFDAVAAEGGRTGIDAARAALAEGSPFDVLITDLGMPHVDGDKVANAVREMMPSTFVIMLTGWGNNMPPGRKTPINVDAVMSKPPNIAELRNLLDNFRKPPVS